MKRKILPWLACLILSNAAIFAQSDFRDGYIVTVNKDTIFGKIDYRSSSKSSKSCLFRTAAETREYTPDQITGYRFVHDRYFSSQIIQGSFVEVLVRGELSLYRNGFEFYIQKKGDEMYKLESKQVRDTIDFKKYGETAKIVGFREDLRWKGILSYLTSDCVESYATIQSMNLEERDMTKFVIEYNLCKGSPYEDFKAKKQWIRLGLGVDAGASLSMLRFSDQDYQHQYLADKYESWDPAFGLSIDISSPRVYERIALETGLYFYKADYYSYIVGNQGLTTANYETKINMSTFAVPVLIKYTIPAEKSSFYINAGMELDSHYNASSSVYTELVNGNTVDTNEGEAMNMTKTQIGIAGGLGYARSLGKMKIGAQLKYFQSSLVRTNPEYKWNLSRLSLSAILWIR